MYWQSACTFPTAVRLASRTHRSPNLSAFLWARRLNNRLSARLEVRRSHPVLECAEHVLDCPPPYRHGVELAIQSGLHRFKHRVMLPSSDTPVVSGRSLTFHRASQASATPVRSQFQ